MTHAAELVHLHQRLISDTNTAFTGTFPGPITPTTAGRLWHKDHKRYRRIHLELIHAEANPSAILREHFGFVTDDDDDPAEAPSPPTTPPTPITPDLAWFQDRLKEVKRQA